MIASMAEAARHVGVSATTLSAWIQDGHLDHGPWKKRTLTAVAKRRARSPFSRTSVNLSAHGTANRWRYGCICDACSASHNERTAEMRREMVRGKLDPIREELLNRLSAGERIKEAAEALGTTFQAIYARGTWDTQWQDEVNRALTEGRDESLFHGIITTYRKHGCACPECRAAKTVAR